MINSSPSTDWREDRRRSAREAIVRAAWTLVGEVGLAGLSLRDLARQAGITTPTVYAYFESKNAIYDAMFGQAATEFADRMAESIDGDDPRALLVGYVRRFVEFVPTIRPDTNSCSNAHSLGSNHHPRRMRRQSDRWPTHRSFWF